VADSFAFLPRLARYLSKRKGTLARDGWDGKFTTYVFSHTHKVEARFNAVQAGP
jgi:hypothetical protein